MEPGKPVSPVAIERAFGFLHLDVATNLGIGVLDECGVAVTEIKPFAFSSPVVVTTAAVMLVRVSAFGPT